MSRTLCPNNFGPTRNQKQYLELDDGGANARRSKRTHMILLLSTRRILCFLSAACISLLILNLSQMYNEIVTKADSSRTRLVTKESAPIHEKAERIKRCSRMKNIDDIRFCYPSNFVRQLGPSCERIERWDDVQRCLTGRFTSYTADHYQISIIGERNSGTKFVMHELQRCFPRFKYNIKVHRDLFRQKHFFQPMMAGDFQRLIVIAIFRDPVEWVAAMREKPYHSPNHLAGFANDTNKTPIPLPWQAFVKRPWTTKRSEFDLQLVRENRVNTTHKGDVCRDRFRFAEIIPCRYDNTSKDVPQERFRGFEPVYELRRDGSGQPFNNILELRSDKLFNFLLQVPMILNLGGYAAVRYEDLLRNGTSFLLEHVASMIGMKELPAGCKGTSPQIERFGRRSIPEGLRQWVHGHLDESIERLLGYV